jgi:hypothetical protein
MLNASDRSPAIAVPQRERRPENPAARGEKAPTAVVPHPLRR